MNFHAIDWHEHAVMTKAQARPERKTRPMPSDDRKPLVQFTKPDGRSVWVDADCVETIEGTVVNASGDPITGTRLQMGSGALVLVQGDPAAVADRIRDAGV
jgi:hypothetical protein